MRLSAYLIGLLTPLLLAGCHSHYIHASLYNKSATPMSVVEVQYPHASFGTQQLLPGGSFPYRFKLLGSGPVKITFIDAQNVEHSKTGPWLNEGQEGQLSITLQADGRIEFQTDLRP